MKSILFALAVLGLAASTAGAQTTAGSSTTIIVPVVAQTGSYSSEVTLFNPNAAAIDAVVSYYDANNLPTAGPKTCAPVNIPAHRSVPFDLASRCPSLPSAGTASTECPRRSRWRDARMRCVRRARLRRWRQEALKETTTAGTRRLRWARTTCR